MAKATSTRKKGIVGAIKNDYWIYDSETGFDLTRPLPVTSGPKKGAVTLSTTTSDIAIDPAISALVIIDMQNFFLSPALGRSADSKGLEAEQRLLRDAIPAARTAGVQIVWLNWGLTHEVILAAPPSHHRSFGFHQYDADEFEAAHSSASVGEPAGQPRPTSTPSNTTAKDPKIYVGLGCELGDVVGSDNSKLSAGRMLVRDQWNTQLSPALDASYKASLTTAKPDVWVHKLRMSGMHDRDTDAIKYFKQHNIKTLLFAGVNTDQCVGGTVLDAFCQGFDCIMLTDGCATSSPEYSRQCWEYNGEKVFGFATDCAKFREGVETSLHK